MERDDVIAAVERAFASVERGAVTLHEAEAMDDYATAAERAAARQRDGELDWRELSDAAIEECPNALPFLDPVSWRFYLPAFMRCGLRRMDAHGSVIDRTIYALDLGQDEGSFEHKLERFRILDAAQREVVCRFLELAAQDDALCDAVVAEQALERYWRESESESG